jgi:hypothetical protein
MAASAAQTFLQCRYRSLARYWTILAEEAPRVAGNYVNSLNNRSKSNQAKKHLTA